MGETTDEIDRLRSVYLDPEMDRRTYDREDSRLNAARALYEAYSQFLFSDPARAKTQMIAGIQVALREAFAQGHDLGRASDREAA